MGSSYLSTVGLNYINYPTKVVFRSCKLIPTMLVALIINKEMFSPSEIGSAVAVCAGLILFAFADMVRKSALYSIPLTHRLNLVVASGGRQQDLHPAGTGPAGR
jgi:drug/metabolite transporter (DMT)-like permease